jgi:hypothetical protein
MVWKRSILNPVYFIVARIGLRSCVSVDMGVLVVVDLLADQLIDQPANQLNTKLVVLFDLIINHFTNLIIIGNTTSSQFINSRFSNISVLSNQSCLVYSCVYMSLLERQ